MHNFFACKFPIALRIAAASIVLTRLGFLRLRFVIKHENVACGKKKLINQAVLLSETKFLFKLREISVLLNQIVYNSLVWHININKIFNNAD